MRIVDKVYLLIGLLTLALAVFKEGKMSMDFTEFPPDFIFPETTIMWRLIVGCMGIGMVGYSFYKPRRK